MPSLHELVLSLFLLLITNHLKNACVVKLALTLYVSHLLLVYVSLFAANSNIPGIPWHRLVVGNNLLQPVSEVLLSFLSLWLANDMDLNVFIYIYMCACMVQLPKYQLNSLGVLEWTEMDQKLGNTEWINQRE